MLKSACQWPVLLATDACQHGAGSSQSQSDLQLTCTMIGVLQHHHQLAWVLRLESIAQAKAQAAIQALAERKALQSRPSSSTSSASRAPIRSYEGIAVQTDPVEAQVSTALLLCRAWVRATTAFAWCMLIMCKGCDP